MTKEIIIILLAIALFYLYQQNKSLKKRPLTSGSLFSFEEENYKTQIDELETELGQAKSLEKFNQGKLQEQTRTISNQENEIISLRVKLKELEQDETGKVSIERLEREKDQIQQELNSILDKWNWGKWKPKTASEFIDKFEPWIDECLKAKEENKTSAKQVGELKERIAELEREENNEELEIERDELKRKNETLNQEITQIGNQLRKQVNESQKSLESLKTESNKQIETWKEKYKAKVKQLDEESSEFNKLETENEKLETKIRELEAERQELLRSKSPMPGDFPTETEELTKKHQEQLRKINLLFDENAKNYETIDFEGLYSLISKMRKKDKK